MGLFLLAGISIVYSQTISEDHKKAFDWAQGGNIFEDWFMKEFLAKWKALVWSEYGTFIDMARALGGCFALVYFAIKSYEMMTGDKKLEIMPLLRPFGLCMIIIYWGSFTEVVSFPTNLIARHTSHKQELQQKKVNNLRYIRAEYQYAVVQGLFEASAETEIAAEESKGFWGSVGTSIKESALAVIKPIVQLKEKLAIGIQLVMTQTLELIGLWILRIAVYVLFAIQVIYSGILIMLGPFSVAMSIHPMFKDSLSTWISRFISVNLYVGIAFIIMFVGGVLQEFAMQSEINKYKEMVDLSGGVVDMTKLLYLKSSGLLSFGTVFVSFVISAITMFTVPSISTWIVSTSGATSAVSTMGRGAQTMGRFAGKIF